MEFYPIACEITKMHETLVQLNIFKRNFQDVLRIIRLHSVIFIETQKFGEGFSVFNVDHFEAFSVFNASQPRL